MALVPTEASSDSSPGKESEFNKLIKSVNKGIVLRGSLYETGGIHSFWIKSAQKNLIAVLFELPEHPVKIGDKWSLNINLIANDYNFECDSAYKLNEVQLIDIKKMNGNTIAVLKYNIVEYVDGNFMGKETMMKFSHQAVAEFSIEKGRWVSYNGIMSIDSMGVMSAGKKTEFSLIDRENADK